MITRAGSIVTGVILLGLAGVAWAFSSGSPEGTPLMQGDVNCDANVNAVDALHVLRVTAGLSPTAGCLAAGDVDCDGKADAVDALRILRHVAALPAYTPAACTPIGLPLPTETPTPTPGPSATPAQCPAATPTPSPTPTPTPIFFPFTVVTLCNEATQTANGLHIALSGNAASLNPVTGNAPGCPAPTYDYAPEFPPVYTSINVVWGSACVDPGETVTLEFGVDCTPGCTAPHVVSCDWLLDGASINGCTPPPVSPSSPTPTATPTPVPTPTPTPTPTSTPTPTLTPTPSSTPVPRTAAVTVNKTYSDGTKEPVPITFTCTSGTLNVSGSEFLTEPGSPAHFIVTGFAEGATCTATEHAVPGGYIRNDDECAAIPLEDDADVHCTIINMLVTPTRTQRRYPRRRSYLLA